MTSDFELSHGIRTSGPPPAPHSELLQPSASGEREVSGRSSAPRAGRQLRGAELHRACGRPLLPGRPGPQSSAARLGADAVEHAARDRGRRARRVGQHAHRPPTRRPRCDDRGPRHGNRVSQLAQVPQVAGLHRNALRPSVRLRRQEQVPTGSKRPRDVRRGGHRRVHQQRPRADRAGLRGLDHACPDPRCERSRGGVDDRARDPLRGQAGRPGDQPRASSSCPTR